MNDKSAIDKPESKAEYAAEFIAVMVVGFVGGYGCMLLFKLLALVLGL